MLIKSFPFDLKLLDSTKFSFVSDWNFIFQSAVGGRFRGGSAVYKVAEQINAIQLMTKDSGGFSAGSDPSGPVAGIGVPMSGMISRKKTILGKGKYPGARTRWGLKRKKKKKKDGK